MKQDKLTITRERITPEIASQMLETNIRTNRNIALQTVRRYSIDMMSGHWSDNGETIKFDKDGHLIDGQHRLSAIVYSGCTVTLWVARGVDESAFKTVDVGMPRTAKQLLKMSGNDDPIISKNTLVGTCNFLFKTLYGTNKPSQSQLEECIEANHALFEWLYTSIPNANRVSVYYTVVAVYMHLYGVEDSEINGFIDGACFSRFDENKPVVAYKFCVQAESWRKTSLKGSAKEAINIMLKYAYSYVNALKNYTNRPTVYQCEMDDRYKLFRRRQDNGESD